MPDTDTTEPAASKWQPSTNRGIPLLREVLGLIEAEVAAWDQGDWIQVDLGRIADSVNLVARATEYLGLPDSTALSEYEGEVVEIDLPPTTRNLCGTAGCLAGHAVMAVGDMPHMHALVGVILGRDALDVSLHQVTTHDTGMTVNVDTRAQDLLGLDNPTADILFDASNTIADLRHMVELIESHGDLDEVRDKCSACDEWLWRCGHEGGVCDDCDQHADECDCEQPLPCCGETSEYCVCEDGSGD
ncbi:hypothetical protein SEA_LITTLEMUNCHKIN_74 [Gordonia phage LittleMunchkin]|nr:hypothetical protein SEA_LITTLEMUNCHKIN_74 [Gordonia phage LittleMunchkin]